jgi:hypothetical protein
MGFSASQDRTKMNSTIRTPEQTKAEHIHRMGHEHGTIYSELWQQIAWVHFK